MPTALCPRAAPIQLADDADIADPETPVRRAQMWLRANGYENHVHTFPLQDAGHPFGALLVATPEALDEDGEPYMDDRRWLDVGLLPSHSFEDIVDLVFMNAVGRYRVVAVVVAQDFLPPAGEPSLVAFQDLTKIFVARPPGGGITPPGVHVLVYEFIRTSTSPTHPAGPGEGLMTRDRLMDALGLVSCE